MTNNFAICVKSLIKQYGKFTAVNNISFKVKSGEIFALLGPNGAGKTTIVEIIECLKKPTKGEVEVFGINIRDLRSLSEAPEKSLLWTYFITDWI